MFELWFVDNVIGNPVRQHVDEHLLEVVVGETTAVLSFHLLPSPNVSRQEIRAGTFGESVQGPDSCQGDLECTTLVVSVQAPPQFESIVGFAACIGHTMCVHVIGNMLTDKSP